jgi:hypothetical protein
MVKESLLRHLAASGPAPLALQVLRRIPLIPLARQLRLRALPSDQLFAPPIFSLF